MMRIIFTGGGTAGHVNPAIAVADAIKRIDRDAEILFVGTPKGMENALVRAAGYPIWHIDISGLERRLTVRNIRTAINTLKSFGGADDIINRFHPDAVFGTGGYVCYPLVRQACKRGIFTAVHESNAVAGLAIKMLSGKVDRVYLNFEQAGSGLKCSDNIRVVGNPVRGEVLKTDRERARMMLGIGHPIPGCEGEFATRGVPIGSFRHVLLSFGGSLGAETLNREILGLMNGYARLHPDTLMVHACGKNGYAEFMRRAEETGVSSLKNVIISEFLFDLPLWLSASDLVICRSGANTVSELAGVGRAAILIPSPNVTADHQYKNAKVLGDSGAAFVLRENPNELARLEQLVLTVLGDRRLRENMEVCAASVSPRRNAAEYIAEEIFESVSKRASV